MKALTKQIFQRFYKAIFFKDFTKQILECFEFYEYFEYLEYFEYFEYFEFFEYFISLNTLMYH